MLDHWSPLGVWVLIAVAKIVHAALPQVFIYCISITPTPSRWKLWPIVREANRLTQAHTETDTRLHFVDLPHAIQGPDGKPDRSLFWIDRLRPNKKRYTKWTSAIQPILQADLSQDLLEINPLSELLTYCPIVIEIQIAWGEMDSFQHVNITTLLRA